MAKLGYTLSLPTGQCTQWTIDWTGVDGSGRRLAPGDYTLTTSFLADELSGVRTQTYGFQLS